MPAEKAPMKHVLGLSERQIAVLVGVSRSTVAYELAWSAFRKSASIACSAIGSTPARQAALPFWNPSRGVVRPDHAALAAVGGITIRAWPGLGLARPNLPP